MLLENLFDAKGASAQPMLSFDCGCLYIHNGKHALDL
jgi:hypothetical protein